MMTNNMPSDRVRKQIQKKMHKCFGENAQKFSDYAENTKDYVEILKVNRMYNKKPLQCTE